VTNVLNTVSNLVCGDAYIIEGQSNAAANAPGSEAPNIYTNTWIRSYGGGRGYATRADQYQIGYWGMDLASNLWATYNMPICIINGAVSGTCIYLHQPNPTNHYTIMYNSAIYSGLLSTVAAARLTHGSGVLCGIRGIGSSCQRAALYAYGYTPTSNILSICPGPGSRIFPISRTITCSKSGPMPADMPMATVLPGT